jgi:hypothetical protein
MLVKESDANLNNGVFLGDLLVFDIPLLGRVILARSSIHADSSHFFVNGDKGRSWQVLQQVIALLKERKKRKTIHIVP